ncbi:ATP-dependent Clp protease proteolytic subunit-related protein 4- chloroplastic [Striga hermonthica]|uniref:ATP-dependent Clp protease proteolytic subunit n=1 Tax=Striga hermonthica TaxID=68872 RepID=A0A9N7N355_STRHE|nr:ATP-dependent Clp protease proteolytic subunit-related protein 4- chloroplastic [Striga hermonthica]
MASISFPTARTTPSPNLFLPSPPPFSPRSSPASNLLPPYVGGGGLSSDFSGLKFRPASLSSSSGRPKRGVITMVIPFQTGDEIRAASEQPPPDLASLLLAERIVYLGMPLSPPVHELLTAEFLYLQHEDKQKPIYLYINSTGTTKSEGKLGYDTEAFGIHDCMRFLHAPICTICVGNAWGEAAMLLAAGAKGYRAAIPSATIMIKQPISRFQGRATDVEVMRQELKRLKGTLVKLYAQYIGKSEEQIEADIRRPKYFSPSEAVEYGIIDKVLYTERAKKDKGVQSDTKRAQNVEKGPGL